MNILRTLAFNTFFTCSLLLAGGAQEPLNPMQQIPPLVTPSAGAPNTQVTSTPPQAPTPPVQMPQPPATVPTATPMTTPPASTSPIQQAPVQLQAPTPPVQMPQPPATVPTATPMTTPPASASPMQQAPVQPQAPTPPVQMPLPPATVPTATPMTTPPASTSPIQQAPVQLQAPTPPVQMPQPPVETSAMQTPPAQTQTTAESAPQEPENIIDEATKRPELSSFLKAVEIAGKIDDAKMTDKPAPFVVFAPSNEAFAAANLLEKKETMKPLVKYWVTIGTPLEKQSIEQLTGELETIGGAKIKINDDKTIGEKEKANIIKSIPCSNGTIHVVDTVLTPPTK